MDYGERLVRSYGVVFPPSSIATTLARGGPWTARAAQNAVANLLSAPVVDRALHRGRPQSKHLCVPHIVCDCTREASGPRPSPATRRALEAGEKLSQLQKAELQALPPRERVAHSVAYAANRCAGARYRQACVLLFFHTPDGSGHANMLSLDFHTDPEVLSVTCFEPNGSDAARRYDTRGRFFKHFSTRVEQLLAKKRRVHLKVSGLNLQTYLGEHFRSGAYRISRGYPVCEAVVLWFFSLYMHHASQGIETFERTLMSTGRGRLKKELLEWVLGMEKWVERAYASTLTSKLKAVFEGSNVREVSVAYGLLRIHVLFGHRLSDSHPDINEIEEDAERAVWRA